MKILDVNKNLLLISNKNQTKILRLPKLTEYGTLKNISFNLGSLQYQTGIAALCKGCVVHIYDFKYGREIKQIDTYLKLVRVSILKNLIIAVAKQRILIYDLAQNIILCYIPTVNGQFCAIYNNYFNIKLLYPISQNLYEQQEIHTAKVCRLQLLNIGNPPLHDFSGQIISISDDNTISIYEEQEIIRGCSLNSKIIHTIPANVSRQFYVMTQDGGVDNQPLFLQVSDRDKKYLKICEDEDKSYDVQYEGSSKGFMIAYEKQLFVWRGNKVYRTEIDNQPQFFGSSKKIQINEQLPKKEEQKNFKQGQKDTQEQRQQQNKPDQNNEPIELWKNADKAEEQ